MSGIIDIYIGGERVIEKMITLALFILTTS